MLTTKICALCLKKKKEEKEKKPLLSITAGGKERQNLTWAEGVFLFVTHRDPRAARGRAAGTREQWHPRQRPPSRPAICFRGRDGCQRSGSGVRRCHGAGRDGTKRGEGRRGVGEARGRARSRAARVPGSLSTRRREGCKGRRGARRPRAPAIVAGTAWARRATLPP